MKREQDMKNLIMGSARLERHLMVDLHGKSVKEAKRSVTSTIEMAKQEGVKNVTIVTGRGNHVLPNGQRGVLHKAFPQWLKNKQVASSVKDVKKKIGAYEFAVDPKKPPAPNDSMIGLNNLFHLLLKIEKGGVDRLRQAAEKGESENQFLLGMLYLQGEIIESNREEGAKWIQLAAENKHTLAQLALGNLFEEGKGVKQDYKKAVEWYGKAAAQKECDALVRLGKCYFLGQGVRQNDDEAIRLFKEAAELNYGITQLNLGYIYANGYGVEVDDKQANAWFLRAAQGGNVVAQAELGLRYWNGIGIEKADYLQALIWLRKAADAGDATSQFYMGVAYANGRGVDKNDGTGFSWYLRAANQDDSDAQLKVAIAYLCGIGVEKDLTKCLGWLGKATAQENMEAFFLWGVLYLQGAESTIQPDQSKAYTNFRIAAERDHSVAQRLVGLFLLSGNGAVVVDEKEGKRWLEAAAEQGDGPAYYHLGSLREEMEDAKATQEAIVLYQKAADQGYVEALKQLGRIYLYGWDVPADRAVSIGYFKKAVLQKDIEAECYLGDIYFQDKDYVRSLIYYKLAASQNHPKANGVVGHFYEDGIGMSRDLSQAYDWYKKGADLGDDYSQHHLGLFYLEGLHVKQNDNDALGWFLKAAHQDNPDAQNCAGMLLLKQQDDQKKKEGIEWLLKAASKNQNRSEFALALLYGDGKLVPKDITASIKWYERSASHGYGLAAYQLFTLYFSSRNDMGIKDIGKAAIWLCKAAELGHPEAKQMMAQFPPGFFGQLNSRGEVPADKAVVPFYAKKDPSSTNRQNMSIDPDKSKDKQNIGGPAPGLQSGKQ